MKVIFLTFTSSYILKKGRPQTQVSIVNFGCVYLWFFLGGYVYPYGLPGCLGHIFIMHISHYHKESYTNELIY